MCFIENLALHKQAWQSSFYFPNTGANRAVDGRYMYLFWSGGHCAVSGRRETGEWRVDLGGVKIIHFVFLQYATHNIVWGTGSFIFFILV